MYLLFLPQGNIEHSVYEAAFSLNLKHINVDLSCREDLLKFFRYVPVGIGLQ